MAVVVVSAAAPAIVPPVASSATRGNLVVLAESRNVIRVATQLRIGRQRTATAPRRHCGSVAKQSDRHRDRRRYLSSSARLLAHLAQPIGRRQAPFLFQ